VDETPAGVRRLRSLARLFANVERFRLQRFAPKCQSEDLDATREEGDNPFTMRSLGVLLVAFVGLAAVQGCGSDSKGSKGSTLGTAGASGAAGSASTVTGAGGGPTACNPVYCPTVSGTTPCCLQDGITCGMNPGNGCVPFSKPDAGSH
jgi:hypothetical protein